MKKTLIFALVAVMLLSACVIGLNVSGADYSSLLGEAPSDPQYKFEVSSPSSVYAEDEITVSVTLKSVKQPIYGFQFNLYYDNTKVEPVVKQNIESGNEEMKSFFVSLPSTWKTESFCGLFEDNGYYLFGLGNGLATVAVKSDNEVKLEIPFKVKSNASDDIVFYVKHYDDYDNNIGQAKDALGDIVGSGSYSVSTVKQKPVTAIGAKYNSDGDSLKFGTKFIKEDGKTVKELGMYVIFESDLGKKSATSSNIVKSSKAVKLKAEAVESSDYVKYQGFEKYESFVYTVTFDGLKGKTSKNIIAMPYVIYSDGETFYGDPITRSYDGVKAAG